MGKAEGDERMGQEGTAARDRMGEVETSGWNSNMGQHD